MTKPTAPPVVRRWRLVLWPILVLFLFGLWGARSIHPLLATTHRVPTRCLVVEGWLPDYALEEALGEFQRGGYERMFTTGGPLPRGSHLAAYRTYSQIAAATLQKLGLATNVLTAVEAPSTHRNRTFVSATALRDFCREHGLELSSLNLVSLGPHARRSRLCFQRAFGSAVKVGVISVEDRDYEAGLWWRYSEGVKTVGGEVLALAYAWWAIDYGD